MRADRPEEDPDDQTVQEVHARMIRTRLCRAITRKIDVLEAATGKRSPPLEHLLGVIGSGGLGRADADAAQLKLFEDHPDADFALALEICETTGARVIHSGSRAVYYRPDDKITIPNRNRFRDPAAYFNARFRLTARWAEKRVGWKGALAEGELVAVLASVFLAGAANIPVVDDADYRGHHGEWLRAIRRDAAFLDRVLDQARKVADYILGVGDAERTR